MISAKLAYRTVARSLNALSYLSPRHAGQLAFRLFALTPAINIRPKEAAFLNEARSARREVAGHSVMVYEWGETTAPAVFCTYGWGYNAGRWRHFVPALVEAGYRVVAYDPPGHGRTGGRRYLDFPMNVAIQRAIVEELGGVELVLAHSLGGSCVIDTVAGLPPHLRPRRMCLMAIVSEVRWMFSGYVHFLGLNKTVYRGMEDHIYKLANRRLDDFDVSQRGAGLSEHIEMLQVHDPDDRTTAFRNAQRNLSYWPGSYLYAPRRAGHHLGTAEVTRNILRFLIKGEAPEGAEYNRGQMKPLPTAASSTASGITDFYG